ncbi:MAG TPA: dihydrodipicolinate synthase family protein [Leeuwenhoekiella sp.]|uniref:dihydrodipicolinate synthase family protein n=1 Tax=Leeuwenhoekiella palythoae TaxID=573501 RepID=UPI000C3538CD|nr:dihydrodipicolinate synthase family protein [Leeuwenhoekiella palythoae]MAS20037.1 dihydrodipicolinate synthase family protein [Leeuwenhoekiella sp.]MBH13248.1 dihydrodipicolinate synthase family protein [Leeuwenhoekiella sp.]UBZ09060.1 dihydrodipicolinate synthase family protein [Leeuwenhoekiella palythoae]HBO28982.1 dihydrodipicolinate synthase family protein [Leeuwenhoekiella sp.]HCQ76744.1 dihydrodipicolinate synthase family protein [Leeuwenhoekiella sp.]|tara:strand:- start:1628 stop:2563 length:936 start_codon:yes stop_codon:yes gene_type:complete
MQINWEGVMPAVTTKFTADDKLDLDLFEVNIKAQLDAGVHGIVLGGTLGEASTLTDEEKSILTRKTVEIVAGSVPVMMNIAEQTTKGAIAAAKQAEEDGAAGLMMLPPMRYKASDREVVAYFKAVAQSTSLPIMVYNNPVDYKIEVTLDMFEELLEEPNIQAVKESTRDISNVTRIKNRFGDRLKIMTGVDTLALESLLMGADGWVAGLVCAFPAETVAIYELQKAGLIDEALAIYRWFLPLLELDIDAQLVQNIKLAEVYTKIGSEHVRAPRLPLAGARREEVIKIIEEGLANRPTLPEYKGLNTQQELA